MSRGSRQLALAVAALAAAGLVALGLGGSPYSVRAEFADAAGLRKNSSVKIDGVPVGKVEALELTGDDLAVATLELDAAAAPIGDDAAAKVRPEGLLGEKYVDLDPGDPGRPALSGLRIPAERTGAPVELDDLIDVLDPETRSLLGVLINESGIALSGRGVELSRMLAELPPALDQSRELVGDLAADNRALGRLVEESDSFLASLASERAALGRLIASGEGALSTAASRQAELGETVRQAPGTVSQLRRSLGRLDQTARSLGPAAAALDRAAPQLTALLEQLPPFTAAAEPTLRRALTTAPALGRLGRDATPVLGRLSPATTDLARYARALAPASGALDASIDDTLGVLEGWVRAIQVRDGAGHLYRSNNTGIAPETIAEIVNRYLRPLNGAADDERRRHRGRPGEDSSRQPSRRGGDPDPSSPPDRERRSGSVGDVLDFLVAP